MLTAPTLYLFGVFAIYCQQRNLPIVISSLKEDVIGRVSLSHREGRAIDFSTKGWTKQEIDNASKYFNDKYAEKLGAYSKKELLEKNKLVPRVLVYHKIDGNVYHFHLQTRPISLVHKEDWASLL